MKVEIAIKSRKGLKKANINQGRKVLIPALKEEDGTITTDRERIIDKSAELSTRTCTKMRPKTS